MLDIILVDRNEVREVEQEEKAKWIRSVLEKMKLPLKKFWPQQASMENLRKMRISLREYHVDLIGDANDGIQIYANNELVAEWVRPRYKLVEDPTQKDIQRRFYYEMHLITKCIYDKKQEKGNA